MTARPGRERLDLLLVARGLADSRAKAQALVLSGRVRSGETRLEKPGEAFPADLPIEIEPGPRFVGRGAEKLDPVLDRFAVRPEGRDALDVGASTGGFTEVLLTRGARRVIALDVGRGQLDWTLRNDPRVVVLEGRNARTLHPSDLPYRPSLAVVDVSFIGLSLVLPAVSGCLATGGEIVALLKPQFEVGRGRVGRGGIVREPDLHREVLDRAVELAEDRGWGFRSVAPSPIRGAKGNVEFFLHLVPGSSALEPDLARARCADAVDEAHRERA